MDPASSIARAAIVGLVALAVPSVAAGAVRPLRMLPEPYGCVADEQLVGEAFDPAFHRGECVLVRGMGQPGPVVISPDGKNAYVADHTDEGVGGIVALRRDPRTGSLAQLDGVDGCVREKAAFGCAVGRGLRRPWRIAVSPRGDTVYATSLDGVAVFARDAASGRLTQLPGATGCIDETGRDGCTVARSVGDGADVAVSPGGESVYVSSSKGHGIAVFARERVTGALTQLAGTAGCVTQRGVQGCARLALLDTPQLTLSPDGRHLYATSYFAATVTGFRRTTGGALRRLQGAGGCVRWKGRSGCRPARAMFAPASTVISPDGANLYVGSIEGGSPSDSGGLAVLARSKTTGRLHQLAGANGCIDSTGRSGCARGRTFDGDQIDGLSASADGARVYALSAGPPGIAWVWDAVLVLRRARSGRLLQPPGRAGCMRNGGVGGCARAPGHLLASGFNQTSLSPDGASLYVSEDGTFSGMYGLSDITIKVLRTR